MARAEWQAVLFASAPSRRDLLKLHPIWETRELHVRVHRNHAFEPVASVAVPYLAFAGYTPTFTYSGYDDSLAFNTPGAADVELLWLDFTRYRTQGLIDGLAAWVGQRLATLRAQSDAPILVPDFAEDSDAARAFNSELREIAAGLPAVYVCDQAQVRAELGERYIDDRAAAVAGTRMSNAACVRSARLLGSRWLPAAVAPRLKAIVLDLDNTLYEGVLGEDGSAGVRLTEGHAALQRKLVDLGREGLFLAVCSRNEPADVHELFAARADFPLRPEHLATMQVSWAPKAAGLRQIAEALRIGVDAILFVDDNPGELAAVTSELPGVATLYAGPRAEDTLRALDFFPGLHRWRADETDALRARDLAAARIREEAAAGASDPDEYLRSLAVRLRFTRDAQAELERLASLSNKTNQFNLSLRRLSVAETARFMEAPDHAAISVRLSDRLSDSGIIGAVFTRVEGDTVLVEDLCISCRALGRNLEDVIVTEAIRCATAGSDVRRVRFRPVDGPRNQPALEWLARFTDGAATPDESGWVSIPWDPVASEQLVARVPVMIERDDAADAATVET
jgi:FkbH-like protein